MAGVEVRGLKKAYGSTVVVDGVDLSIQHGQLVCLLGPSGCGKTTTLRLLAGFLEPDRGEILVDGRLLSAAGRVVPPERRNMSMIFQSYAVWPHMTVFDNVAYGLRLRGIARAEMTDRVHNMLGLVRLDGLAQRFPGELSGGQQQRVALARALVIEPQTLLLDEPLSNLDAHLREEMRFEIRRLHETCKITTVYVTHDQSEAMVIADRIAVMKGGRIEQVGGGEDLYERPKTEFVASFIGQTNLLPGTLGEEPGTVRCVGTLLRTASEDRPTAAPGTPVSISIRPYDIQLNGRLHGAEQQVNFLSGQVVRSYYLGGTRDYQIEVGGGDGITLRVLSEPGLRIGAGERVTLVLPVDKCRVLSGSS
ncbi:MAG: ABC transporter ATP-binding protein [Chloroflexi bacterium]|nr:ABC transporter ATP-binding protein [Chloroflexota bacterium]